MREGGAAPPQDKATSLSLCISEHTVAARHLQCHRIPHETTTAADPLLLFQSSHSAIQLESKTAEV